MTEEQVIVSLIVRDEELADELASKLEAELETEAEVAELDRFDGVDAATFQVLVEVGIQVAEAAAAVIQSYVALKTISQLRVGNRIPVSDPSEEDVGRELDSAATPGSAG